MNTKRVNDKEKDLCKQWIHRFCEATKGISQRFSSYNLKHFVEHWCREYISNESFIAACEDLGIRMKPTDESGRNCYFALKVKPDGVCNRH